MALKTILFVLLFVAASGGALFAPIWGVLGYAGEYSIGADRQWWSVPLRPLGIRYSLTLAAFSAVGIAVNWRKLRFGRSLLCGHEKLALLFLALVWLSAILGPETVGRYTTAGHDHPSIKLTKIMIFGLMLTHVVTDLKNLNRLLWVLIIGALILGLQAWSTPYRAFENGRLERVGGPDFSEANFFAAYMATMLPLIGIQFLRTGRMGKVVCLLTGAFTANAIILTRSRGSLAGLALGALVAVFLAPRRYRAKIIICLAIVFVGGLYLSDPQFLHRMSTITRSEEERDASAQNRIVLTMAAMHMLADQPLGVGPGNFYQNVGRYNASLAKADVHNTYLRCATEIGVQGIIVFGMFIVGAGLSTRRVMVRARKLPPYERSQFEYLSFGLAVSLATLLGCCLFISLLYVEFIWWWLLALPVCLTRVLDNLEADLPSRYDATLRLGARRPMPAGELLGVPGETVAASEGRA